MSAAYDLARALDPRAKEGRKSWQVPCPAHNDRKPSLSIGTGRGGMLLLHCFAGCSQDEVIGALKNLGLWRSRRSPMRFARRARHQPKPKASPEPSSNPKLRKLHELFLRKAVPVAEHPVARKYLEGRACVVPVRKLPGCAGPPLRAVDVAYHWPSRTWWPAMLALVVHPVTGRMQTFHWTFLAPDGSGKAPVDRPRLLAGGLPSFGVVRLTEDLANQAGPAPRILGIAEGVESALSLAHLRRRGARASVGRLEEPAGPMIDLWATLSAGNLARLPVSEKCAPHELIIAVDNDPAGRKAAHACARRWHAAGVKVRLVEPKSGDVNDVILEARR